MQKTIFFLFSIFATVTKAQSPLFYAYGNISSVSDIGGGNYNVTINNYNGGYKMYPDANYEAADIPASPTTFVLWGSCARFQIFAKVSNVPLVLSVTDVNGALASGDLNGSRIFIGQEARAGAYNLGFQGNVADGNSGSQAGVGPFENACAQNYYRDQLALSIIASNGAVSDGTSIVGSGTTGSELSIFGADNASNGQFITSTGTGGVIWKTLQTGTDLDGDGVNTPLSIAQQGATFGQVLSWNGSTWAPATNAPYEETFTATNAQSDFPIQYAPPIQNGGQYPVKVFRNGVRLDWVNGTPNEYQFTYSSSIITTFQNFAGDKIRVEYIR